MSDESDKLREERRAIGEVLATIDPFSETEDGPEASMLSGWVVIAEFIDDNGDRWTCHFSGDATGTRGLPTWAVLGFCAATAAVESARLT